MVIHEIDLKLALFVSYTITKIDTFKYIKMLLIWTYQEIRVWYGLSTDSLSTASLSTADLSTRPFYRQPVYRQTVLSTASLSTNRFIDSRFIDRPFYRHDVWSTSPFHQHDRFIETNVSFTVHLSKYTPGRYHSNLTHPNILTLSNQTLLKIIIRQVASRPVLSLLRLDLVWLGQNHG